MTVTNRSNLPQLLDDSIECLGCGATLDPEFMQGLLARSGWCEDCYGRHVYQLSKEPGICGEDGCGEPYRHRVHIRQSQVLGHKTPPPDRAYIRGPQSAAFAERLGIEQNNEQ